MAVHERSQRRGIEIPTRVAVAGVLLLAGSVGLSAYGGYLLAENNQGPQSSPIPGGIVEPSLLPSPTLVNPTESILPTPSPTPEVTASPTPSPVDTSSPSPTEIPSPSASPSPEITPYPTPDTRKWWERIPPNPYKNPDEVPLAPDWTGRRTASVIRTIPEASTPYYGIAATVTIYDLVPDVENNRLWIGGATDVPDAKIKITTDKISYPMGGSPYYNYEITGAPLWIAVNDQTFVNGSDPGLVKLVQELKIGDEIVVYMAAGGTPNSFYSSSDINMAEDSWNRLLHSGGKSFPRKDMVFKFLAGNLRR